MADREAEPGDFEEKELKDEQSRDSLAADNAAEEDREADVAKPSDEEKAVPPGDGPGPPPDGGLVAWLQVLGAWMLFFNTWGVLNTFGIFQTYYEGGERWTASSSNIAWIGSIQSVMVLLGGLIAGPIFDRGYLRTLLVVGSFGVVFGFMMLSLTHTYWQALLAQGFTIGLGGACLYIPSLAIMPQYFTKKLGLTIGIAASGSSSGGIIYPIMFYKLIDQVGFGWTVRIIGFIALATLLVPITVMKLRVKPGKVRSMIDWSAFTDFPYIFFVLGSMIGFIGLYVGFFYTSYYGEATRIVDQSLAFYLVPILNAGSVLGRTLPNWLSDKVGPFNVIAPGAIIVGIVLLCYMAVTNVGGMVVVTLFFGFFSGIFIALPPVLIVRLTEDKSKVGTRMGMGFAIIAGGVLAGGPGGGSILGADGSDLHWDSVWTYGGVTVLAASAIFIILRIVKGGVSIKSKV